MQWKALLVLVLNCDHAAIELHPQLFARILHALHAQLQFAWRAEHQEGHRPDELGPLGIADMLGLGDSVGALLKDSFLRAHLLHFMARLSSEQAKLHVDLQMQVRSCVVHSSIAGTVCVAMSVGS